MITLPVTVGFSFDEKDIIGSITLDETKLPALPEYCFSIGYRLTVNKDSTDYTLMNISLISDNDYIKYLQQSKGYELI
jgi:uncharacterized HAD superfamily protein